jgi:hypothetical protein
MSKPPSPSRRGLPAIWCLGAFLCAMAVAALARGTRRQQPASPGPALHFAHGGNAAEVPMELASNAVFVPVRVAQGLPSSWLLDTGSPRTFAAPAVYPGPSGDGQSLPVLSLPGLDFLRAGVAVQSFSSLGAWYGHRVSGVIGDDLLSRLVAQLNYSRRSIELYDPGSYHPPSHTKKLDVRWVGGLPTVRTKLRLGGRTVQGDFVLNTGGNAGVFVSSAFLAANRMYPYAGQTIPGTVFAASGKQAVSLARGEWLDFGSWHITMPVVAIGQPGQAAPAAGKSKKKARGKTPPIAGWIGGRILRKFRIVLDFPGHRILLAPNNRFIFPIEADASGATIVAAGPSLDNYEVREVAAGSPAAAAGLLPGDRIVVINGESVSDFTLDQVRDLFSQAGDTPVLSVLRLGRRVRIRLELHKRL